MTIYLKEKMLWKYVTGERTRPIRAADDSEEKYSEKLEKWESQNNKIIFWISNTVVASIAIEFHKYNTAKEV